MATIRKFHYRNVEVRFKVEDSHMLTVNGFDLETVTPVLDFSKWLQKGSVQLFIDNLCMSKRIAFEKAVYRECDAGDVWVHHSIGKQYAGLMDMDFQKWYCEIADIMLTYIEEMSNDKSSNGETGTENVTDNPNSGGGAAIKIFDSPQFGKIRTAGTPDNPLFCLADVARVLGLKTSKLVQRLSDDVLSKYPISDGLGRQQVTNFVNEDGLYDVILDSRKPEARIFRKWITGEVLPSIRKTGHYGTPRSFAEALRLAAEQQEKIERQQALLEQQRPMLEYINASIGDNTDDVLWTIPKLVKVLNQNGYKQKVMKFYEYLRANGYLYKKGKENLPCQRYLDMGLFYIREHQYDNTGRLRKSQTTMVTTKGQIHFIHKLIGSSADAAQRIISESADVDECEE